MTTSEEKEWARQLINYHKNPLIKLDLSGSKYFLPTNTSAEKEITKNALDSLTNIINSKRVERRCARALAIWLPDQKQAEVVKVSGTLSNFGFANKNGKFLYPEEILYLLETNRLELQWNNVPLSIQQTYEIIFDNDSSSLGRYITYRKLLLSGFRLLKEIQVQKYESTGEPSPKKLCLENCNLKEKEVKNRSSNEIIRNIFNKLKESGPKKFALTDQILKYNTKDYKLFLPGNATKTSSDFDLLIYQDKYLDPMLSFINEKTPTIIGYTDSELVGYYCIGSVDIPDLT